MNHDIRTAHTFLGLLLLLAAWAAPAPAATPAATPAEEQAEAPLRMFRDELQARLEGLSAVAGDYAHWNDAWLFATGARPRFPGEGLLAPALARIGVTHMLVLDRNQRTRLSLRITSAGALPAVIPPDAAMQEMLREAIGANLLHAREASLQALAQVGGNIALVVARPVLRESGSDTPGGWLAFAQPLAGETLDTLLRLLGPSARAYPAAALQDTALHEQVHARIAAPGGRADIFSVAEEDLIQSWLVLRGFDGRALWAVQLQTTAPRAPVATPALPAGSQAEAGTATPGEDNRRGGGLVLLVLIACAGLLALWMWRARRGTPAPGRDATPAPRRTPPAPSATVPLVASRAVPPVAVTPRAGKPLSTAQPAQEAAAAGAPAAPAAAKPPSPAPVAPPVAAPPPAPPPQPSLPDAADIIETAPDGVLVAAVEDGRIVRANPAALRLFGLSEAELKTQHVTALLRVPPEDADTATPLLRLDAPTQHLRRVILDAGGRLRDIDVSVAPLKAGTRATAALFLREAGPQPAERALTRVQADQLTVHYQPIIDLASERICALEALPLWKDTQHGWIHPDDPLLVSHAGRSLDIAQYVLAQATRDLLRWREQGATLVPVSINVAPAERDRANFEAALAQSNANGVPRELLQLEISDGALRDPRSGLLRADVVEQWRALALPVVVDHFGQRGRTADPVGTEAVKLDPNLVRDIATHPPDRDAVEAIIARARPRGITVIAEGVDRWPQLETLRALGCRQAQGPLFSRAVAAEEVLRLLREERIVILAQDPLEVTDELPALRLVKP